jgi:hypothetical protein
MQPRQRRGPLVDPRRVLLPSGSEDASKSRSAAYTRGVRATLFRSKEQTARIRGIPILEAAVHDAVLELGAALLPRDEVDGKLIVAQEFVLPYGRPDVVAAVVDTRVWSAWRRKGIEPCTAPLPLATALLLAGLGGRASVGDLLRPSARRSERSRVRGALAALARRKWVERKGDVFALRISSGDSLRSVSAVEAKLNNWRRAVRQVQSWEGHVDAVWLAFPASYLPNVPRTQPFRRFGLIQVEGEQAQIVRRATGPRARGVRRALTEQYLYARWLAEVSEVTRSPATLKTATAAAG